MRYFYLMIIFIINANNIFNFDDSDDIIATKSRTNGDDGFDRYDNTFHTILTYFCNDFYIDGLPNQCNSVSPTSIPTDTQTPTNALQLNRNFKFISVSLLYCFMAIGCLGLLHFFVLLCLIV